MLKFYSKLMAASAALVLLLSTATPVLALSTGANPALFEEGVATLTAKSGEVWKRDFVDWQRESWGQSQEAKVNDRLHEGMCLGTGSNSWAEVSWPNVKTRVWANSQLAVAPNKRLVYLTQGEMLFRLDKHRKDKDQPYWIWTKVLQARIRGTTVLVQAQGSVTRFTVLEGVVDVTNRLDHSRMTVKPGMVLEIVGYPQPQGAGDTTPPLPAPRKLDGSVTDILYDKAENSKVPVFQDRFSSTNLYTADSHALKTHPLLQCGGTIDSLPLIQKEQKDLPGFDIPLFKTKDEARQNRLIASSFEVKAVPSTADYFVGPQAGKEIKLPLAASTDFPPRGVIIATAAQHPVVPAKAPLVVPPPVILPEDDVPAAAAELSDADMQPLPVLEFGTAPTDVAGVPQATYMGGQTVNSAGALTGSLMGGSTSLVGGAITGTTSALSGTLSGAAGIMPGAAGTVLGATGGVSTLTSGVTSSLTTHSVTNSLTNTVNNVTTGLLH